MPEVEQFKKVTILQNELFPCNSVNQKKTSYESGKDTQL